MTSTRQLKHRLRRLSDPPPPAGLQARLEGLIPAQLVPGHKRRSWRTGWSFAGLATAGAVLFVLSLRVGQSTPAYAETLAAVAQRSGHAGAIHLVARARSRQDEDFSYVEVDGPLLDHEIWIENTGERTRMRIDKPGRSYLFDGDKSTWFHPDRHEAFSQQGGGIDWALLWPASWVERVLEDPDAEVEVISFEDNRDVGRVVMRWPAPEMNGLPPSSFDEFHRELTLEWDPRTLRLTGMERRVMHEEQWIPIWVVSEIDYGVAFSDDVFDLGIPDDVHWIVIGEVSNELAALEPRAWVLRFWELAIAQDWPALEQLCPYPSLIRVLETDPPTELIHLGEAFKAGNYPGYYVPYEVRFGEGDDARIKKHNLAIRNDNEHNRFVFDGGI